MHQSYDEAQSTYIIEAGGYQPHAIMTHWWARCNIQPPLDIRADQHHVQESCRPSDAGETGDRVFVAVECCFVPNHRLLVLLALKAPFANFTALPHCMPRPSSLALRKNTIELIARRNL